MEQLAHHGNGHYAYIDSMAEARKVFVEQGCSLVAIAKDVKLQVEFNPQRVGAYRLIGYENRLMQRPGLQRRHQARRRHRLRPHGHGPVRDRPGRPADPDEAGVDPLKYQKPAQTGATAEGGEWLTVKMRYKDPEADTSKLLTQPLAGGVAKLADAPADFRFAAAVATFGLLLRNVEHHGDADYLMARELAKGALGDDPNGHRAEFLKLVEAAGLMAAKQPAK